MAEHFLPAGTAADEGFDVFLPPERAGWDQSGLRVLSLDAGAGAELVTAEEEWLIIPLSGAFDVAVDGQAHHLRGRRDVFDGPTDTLYLPPASTFSITAPAGGRVAFTSARAAGQYPVQFLAAEDAPIARRGAGTMSRMAHEYLMRTGALRSEKLMAREVYTPGGNWSSYPPHKHDEHNDVERVLVEIYYYEVRPAANGTAGMAIQRIYPSPGKPIDVCAEVHSRDVVIMPHGYHGPSIAAPGYDLYYLNVMAGPAEDATWLMTDDPHYTWLRETWDAQEVDPRLPMTPLNP